MSLTSLPNEVLFMIKGCIPPWDIRTHICYLYVCRRTASLYGFMPSTETEILNESAERSLPSIDEGFWKRACFLAGIGVVSGEDPDLVSWFRIAEECITMDGFCGHPQCGGSLLEYNAKMMEDVTISHPEWNIETESVLPQPLDIHPRADPNNYKIVSNRISKTLTFPCRQPYHPGHDPHQDLYLLSPLHEDENKIHWRPLQQHSLARRSFATFPPLGENFLNDGFVIWDWPVEHCHGLTIWDIWLDVLPGIDKHLLVDQYVSLANHPSWSQIVDENVKDIPLEDRMKTLSVIMKRFPTERSLLSVCHWDGLEFQEIFEDEVGHTTPRFDLKFRAFKPNILPKHWW